MPLGPRVPCGDNYVRILAIKIGKPKGHTTIIIDDAHEVAVPEDALHGTQKGLGGGLGHEVCEASDYPGTQTYLPRGGIIGYNDLPVLYGEGIGVDGGDVEVGLKPLLTHCPQGRQEK